MAVKTHVKVATRMVDEFQGSLEALPTFNTPFTHP